MIGIGGLGHLALQFLRAWGCEVYAFSSNRSKDEEIRNMGAHEIIDSKDPKQLKKYANYFDYIISTVNVHLDWNAYLSTIKPKGRLHFVGATLKPLDIGVFSLIMGQRSVSGSPVGSPSVISTMLDFCVRHNIKPVVEIFPSEKVNDAIEHLRSGKAKYRTVLKF